MPGPKAVHGDGVAQWRRLMTRLLLRDGLQRYRTGLVLVLLGGAYLWRSIPPWVVQRWLWAQSRTDALLVATAVAVGYVVVTLRVARTVVASERLSYWRQFAIERSAWRRLVGTNLAVVHLPWLGTVGYMLMPAPTVVVVTVAPAVWLATVAVHAAIAPRLEPSIRLRRRRAPTSAAAALSRLYQLTVWRREPNLATGSLVGQSGLMALTVLGSWHVARVEPDAVWLLLRTLGVLGGVFAGWPVLAALRSVDRDRWLLDSLAVDIRDETRAHLRLGLRFGVVTIIGTTVAGLSLGPRGAAEGLAVGVLAVVFGTVAMSDVATTGEANRDLHGERAGAVTVRVVAAGVAVHLHVAVLLALVLAQALRARRQIIGAAAVRRRFETTTRDDDHD